MEASPSLTVKELEKHYKQVEKIKKNISKPHILTSKFTVFPALRGKSLHLKKRSETSIPF